MKNTKTLSGSQNSTGYSAEDKYFHDLDQELIKKARQADNLPPATDQEMPIKAIKSADDKGVT